MHYCELTFPKADDGLGAMNWNRLRTFVGPKIGSTHSATTNHRVSWWKFYVTVGAPKGDRNSKIMFLNDSPGNNESRNQIEILYVYA